MRTRTSGLITAAVLAATVSAAAGQKAADPVYVNSKPLKDIVRLYELALVDAVNGAGAELLRWARAYVGPINMVAAAAPKASGVLLPDNSIAFDVSLAEMNVTAIDMYQKLFPRAAKAQTVADPKGERVAATGIPADDPMTSPDQKYSELVREALIQAMVTHGQMLPIGAGQWLTVQVTPVNVAVTNPLDGNPSRKLILSIKGEDLDAFRRRELTADQLRARVVDRRF